MKKKYLLYCFAFLLHFFSVTGTLSAQCTDGLGLVAFTGYQIADKTNPQGQQDQFSFVLLDYIPANTSLYFTDLGLTSTTAFQDIVNAKTDGVLKWTTSTALDAGTHIVIKVEGLIASSGTIEKVRGNFGFGLGGDQLFAYRQDNVPGSIEAALLINKASWDTAVGGTSSSKSVAPAIDAAKKQLTIVSSADEDAFQARWGSALTFSGNRAALRQQVAATNFTSFTSLNSDAVQLTNLAISWNADAPTKSTIQKQDNQLSIVSNACYFQWQKSTDNVAFTDIEGADNSIYTLTPTTESTWYRVKLMGAQVIYSDPFILGPAITTKPLGMAWNTELALLNINIVNVVGNTTRYTLSLQTTVGELAATGTADVSVSRANQNKNLTITGTGPDLNTFLARGAVKLIPSTDYYGNINVNLTLVEELTPTVNIASATTAVTVGRPPVLVAQNYSTFKNTTLTVAAADGLLKDVINLDGGTLQVQVVTGQTNGSLTLNTIDGSFTFTPIKDFVGEGSFSYKVSNGTLESAVTTSKILVKETAASVSTVSSPNLNKIFIAGDAVYIDVNFDKAIFVSNTDEGPKLKLRLDNNVTRTAAFQSAANRTVRFKYTVMAGDVASTKLNYYDVTSLTLEGASINNVSGVPSRIILPAINAPGNLTGVPIRIDGTLPTGDFTINQGGTYTNTKNVKIFTSISDPNVNKLELSNDETIWTTVQAASAGIPWTLSDGDGVKQVYLRLTTAVGNKGLIVRSINLMTTAPVVSGVANNTVYNTDRTITFNKGTATLNGAAFTSGTVVKIDGGYVLVVTDVAGNTTIVNFEIDKTPPAKPTGLKAVFVAGTPDKVVISWNANTEFDLTGYRLNIDAGGANILNQTLGKTVTSYDLTGFEPGEELTIGLTAFDLPGNESVAATIKFSPKFTQTINFAALNDAVYGTADRLLQATASSNLPVTFKTSDATKASVYQDAADGNAWKVKFLKAGEVDIIASQLGNDLYAAAPVVSRTLTITKANITGVTLPNASFIYDGTTKSLTTTGTLPTGVTIGTYTGNAKTDAGIHTVTVQLLGGDNYNNQTLTGTLTISKATITGVTLADATYTYDGTAKSLTAAGILPTGATTGTYVGNAKTDAGTYTVMVTITGGTNYEDLALTATLTISKAQITGLTLPNATYTYDGIAKSLAVAGTLPTGVTIGTYMGNAKTNAGTYTVEATLDGGNNYIDKTLTGTLTISKAAISGLTLPNTAYTYDGTAKSLAVVGILPTGVTIDSYTGNSQTNAGEYDVEALVRGGVNYLDKTLTGTLTINKAEITGLTLADATYTYDGIAKSLAVAGTLPAGVTVAGYVGNGKINAGTYPVEANLVGGANYTDKTLTGTLTINKAEITGVTLPNAGFTYDGTAKSLVVTGTLPTGVTVGTYTGNARIDAGVYPVSVQLLGGNNYNNQTLTSTLTISKATITGVTLAEATYTYDGTAKSLVTTGILPSGATTGTYFGNAKTEAGTYPVTVTIVGGNNYQDLPLRAVLTINKAEITGLTLPNATYTYDGTAKSLAVAGTLPTGVTVAAYTGNAKTNAGTYTVEAMLAGGNNYVDKTITGTLIITKAALAGITFQDASFTYDGKAKSLALTGSLPAGVTFSYVGNGKTEAGQYAVDAVIDGGNNYIGETQHATLTINKATLTGLSLPAARYTYDATSKSLALVGTLPTGASVSYANNAQTNAGLYAVQALVSGGNNYVDQTLTANLQIDKLDLSYLRLLDKTYVYDANTKSLAVDGLVPSFVTLTYDNNGQNKAGQYLVTATVVGTANYTAVSLKANLIIKKAPQKILAVNVPATLSRDAGNIPVEVRSVSGLPVFLKVDDPMVATVKDHRLEVLRLGTVVITATQPGNENYEAAEPLSVTVRVVAAPDAQIPIIVNQALSPNGDGINDFLIMEGIKDFPQNKVTIFDKAGTVLQVIEGYNNVDRVFTGDRQTDGTYFYYIDVKDGNQWKRQKGFFVLKRSAR